MRFVTHNLRFHFVVIFVLACMQYLSVSSTAAEDEIKYVNAPKYLPGTTAAMHKPDFWINNIKGNPDKVYLTPEQIVELNLDNKKKSYTKW